MMTEPPLKTTLAKQVSDQLEKFVLTELKAGDRLPSERELAEKYQVSRTVVREAVHALTTKGLLEVRSRSGVIVSTPTAVQVSQSLTAFLRAGFPELDYRKVMEVRSHLEIQIAGLAAERRNESDLNELKLILDKNLNSHTLEEFVRWDIAFHAALAQATHNELYPLILNSISEIMRAVRVMAFYLNVPEPSWVRVHRYHRMIFEQILSGNPEAARHAMREHLVEAEETMLRVMAMRALQNSDNG
jgi:GntR family transcriptional regulator, transcriptional repressor for pyruvate dehydrogenase complex